MKVAVITYYHDPDNVRGQTLLAAAKAYEGARVWAVGQNRGGWLGYLNVVRQLIEVKRRRRPDVYLLTGDSRLLLPLVLFVAGLRPVIADVSGRVSSAGGLAFRFWLRHCRFILADSEEVAELSARLNSINLSDYRVVPLDTADMVPAKQLGRVFDELA